LREMGNELSIVPCAHNPGVVSELLAGRGVDFTSGSAIKNPPRIQEMQRLVFDPWVRKIPWKRKMKFIKSPNMIRV